METLFERSVDLLAVVGLDGCFKRLNPAWTAALDWLPDQLLGSHCVNFVHPDDVEPTLAEIARLKGGNWETVSFENRYRHRDGSYRWLLWSARANLAEELVYCAAKDITERKTAEAQVRADETLFRSVFQTSPIAMALIDKSAHIDDANESFARLTGFTIEELRSMSMLELTHPDDLARSREIFESALTGNATYVRMEKRYVTKDRGVVFVAKTTTLLRSDRGDTIGAVAMIEDLTERQRSLELAVARDVAVEASRVKSQFLANMSHEIRTPMNGVLGMAQLLTGSELDPAQQNHLNVLRDSAESLLSIINDILDFSRVEAGQLQLESAAFDLRSGVESVVALLTPAARDKSVAVQLSIADNVAPLVIGDQGRVRQVLINLLANAIKFTDAGLVRVTVSAGDQGLTRFEVADTGIGIAESDSTVFEPFSQGDACNTRRFGGSGLGLAICRQLVDLMAGTLGYTSALGVGSTFWFEIPLAPSDRTPRAGAELAPERAATNVPNRAGRVLIVDDSNVNQLVALKMLELLGYRADCVANGREAVAAAGATHYDAILMDCAMPVMDGYEATKQIRRNEGSERHTPIVALTASVMVGDREQCLAAGMDDYLPKPLSLTDLAEVMRRWVPETASL